MAVDGNRKENEEEKWMDRGSEHTQHTQHRLTLTKRVAAATLDGGSNSRDGSAGDRRDESGGYGNKLGLGLHPGKREGKGTGFNSRVPIQTLFPFSKFSSSPQDLFQTKPNNYQTTPQLPNSFQFKSKCYNLHCTFPYL